MKLKLIHKLLLAMFACTALVLVLVILVTRASIGRGFVEFLQQQEQSQIERLAPDLAEWYKSHGSWQSFKEEPGEFYLLVFRALADDSASGFEPGPGWSPGFMSGRGRGPGGQGGAMGPGRQLGQTGPGPGANPGRRNALPLRIYLLDEDGMLVVGNSPGDEVADANQRTAVELGDEVIGWLGIQPIQAVNLPEEEAFIAQLRESLAVGLGLGLVIAALLAWFLARHLSGPVNRVADGIRALAGGDFQYRVQTRGGDEISRLGDHVNRLSTALAEHETARKRWMSDMAHELRTPLAIISGELEAMADGVRPLNSEQLASVQEEVRHLALLVDDLHSLALTDSGALAYKMGQLDLVEVVSLTVGAFEGRAQSKGLELRWEQPDKPVSINGDDQRLRQLLHNLLDNAVRYTDAGGFISINLTQQDKLARLVISDSSPGVDAQECERLFERLYRQEGSRNRNSGGSGLGLAICRNIVSAHAGEISAKPSPHGGLEITVVIPSQS
jgi:two-component system sensor histidine kinase BaeS